MEIKERKHTSAERADYWQRVAMSLRAENAELRAKVDALHEELDRMADKLS